MTIVQQPVVEELVPVETLAEWHARYRRALDHVTASYFFDGVKFSNEEMVNFVNGLDLLDDITRTQYFKTNRFLETGDTYACRSEVHRLFNKKKGPGPDMVNKIKKVGFPTNDLLQEFITGPYIGLFYRMMHSVKENVINCKLDNVSVAVRLEPHSPHPMYGVIEYYDLQKRNIMKIPFFLNRLGKDHLLTKSAVNS